MLNDFDGIDLGLLKLFLLLYADDIVIMSETEEGLHKGLLLLEPSKHMTLDQRWI